MAALAISPSLVGGCRALPLGPFFDKWCWLVRFVGKVEPYGLASEVLVAEKVG